MLLKMRSEALLVGMTVNFIFNKTVDSLGINIQWPESELHYMQLQNLQIENSCNREQRLQNRLDPPAELRVELVEDQMWPGFRNLEPTKFVIIRILSKHDLFYSVW